MSGHQQVTAISGVERRMKKPIKRVMKVVTDVAYRATSPSPQFTM